MNLTPPHLSKLPSQVFSKNKVFKEGYDWAAYLEHNFRRLYERVRALGGPRDPQRKRPQPLADLRDLVGVFVTLLKDIAEDTTNGAQRLAELNDLVGELKAGAATSTCTRDESELRTALAEATARADQLEAKVRALTPSATSLTRLSERLEKLSEKNDELRTALNEATARADQLAAENQRLKEASPPAKGGK